MAESDCLSSDLLADRAAVFPVIVLEEPKCQRCTDAEVCMVHKRDDFHALFTNTAVLLHNIPYQLECIIELVKGEWHDSRKIDSKKD